MWVFSPRSQICPTEKRGLSRSVERFAHIGSIDWEILMEADPDDGIRSPDACDKQQGVFCQGFSG